MRKYQYGKELGFITIMPLMYPYLAFGMLRKDILAFALVTSVAVVGFFFFIKLYKGLFRQVRGYMKRFTIASILINTSGILMLSVKDGSEAFAAIFVFLFLPSVLISLYLIFGNKPAKKVQRLYIIMRRS